MGLLRCKLFTTPTEDPKLEACRVRPAAHITPGSRGDHVKSIQIALNQLSNVFLRIDGLYGPKTAAAVKDFKRARAILGTGQLQVDNIVGKLTIERLDDEMDRLERSTVPSRFVSMTRAGSRHDHATCPKSNFGGKDGRSHHAGTPINPLGGRRINVSGEGETNYLGFEDFVTDRNLPGPPRPLTSTIPTRTVSNICLRDAPISSQRDKVNAQGDLGRGEMEISRIALPGCRLTYVSSDSAVEQFIPFLFSVGIVLERFSFVDQDSEDQRTFEAVVIAMTGDGRFFGA